MVKKNFGSILLIWAIICLLACLFACAPKKKIISGPPGKTVGQLWQIAGVAWKDKDYDRAEQLYQDLLQKKGLSRQKRQTAWKRLAFSSLSNGHLELTEKALQMWSEIDVQARTKWDWYKIKALMYKKQGRMGDFEATLMEAIRKKSSPWELKLQAAHFLTSYFFLEDFYKKAWQVQAVLAEEAGTEEQKKELYSRLYQRLAQVDPRKWSVIRTSYSSDQICHFPYAIIEWRATGHFLAEEEISWPKAWKRMQDILKGCGSDLKSFLEEKISPLIKRYGPPRQTMAILLPLSGSYAQMSWDILRGIDVAQWLERKAAARIQVRVINTSSDSWLKSLKGLPQDCKIIAGPLRKSVWKKIYNKGLQEERTFFAFTSRLRPGKEGRDGFRFFPSRSDQVRTLIETMVNQFGVTDFAVMYPESSYGRGMLNVFQDELAGYQAGLRAIASYDNNDPTGWKDKVADFLDVPSEYLEPGDKDNKEKMLPDPDFRALFLPDSFENAQIMIPEFYFFDVDNLFFLGPALWSQQVRQVSKLDCKYFDLSLMPGMWWSDNPSLALKKLNKGLDETLQGQDNFWVGLGYDFFRFSMALLKRDFPTKGAQERCQLLSSIASDFKWTMAPMSWDSKGRASQDLFLLQPGEKGAVRADLDKIWARFRKRQKTQ